MDIGKKLKEKREERNLTQKELSEILHVSRQTISSWEVGRTYPDLDVLVAISELYNTPLDDLLKEDSQMVRDITYKVKKSERRKVINIILAGLLVVFVGFSLVGLWENYQNNQANAYGLKPSDLIESTWEMNFTTAENLSQSTLSIDSDSVMIWNQYNGLLKPSISEQDFQKNKDLAKELSEAGLTDGVIEYDGVKIEVQDQMYIVSAHGYQQKFERVTETMIRDSNGTEYHKIIDVSSHESLQRKLEMNN